MGGQDGEAEPFLFFSILPVGSETRPTRDKNIFFFIYQTIFLKCFIAKLCKGIQ